MHLVLHESCFPDITISRLFIIFGFSNTVALEAESGELNGVLGVWGCVLVAFGVLGFWGFDTDNVGTPEL